MSNLGPGFALAIRKPAWAQACAVTLNGKAERASESGGWLSLKRDWKQGDVVEVRYRIEARLERRDGSTLQLSALGSEPVEAALFHGPFLLGVHESRDPKFFARPWSWGGANENLLHMPGKRIVAKVAGPAYRFRYRHGGWPGEDTAGLYPIAVETSDAAQQTLAVWLTFQRG